MPPTDKSQAFLELFPRIEADRDFRFACHPGVKCFNACCSNLNLTLTPYDVLRLRKQLGMSFREFLADYGSLIHSPDTGLPTMRLEMLGDKSGSCPFLRPQGCAVYADRPGACRTYPIGRAVTYEEGELRQQFFLIQEPHCQGFAEERCWTPPEWFADQGLTIYNEFNDRYVRLMTALRDRGMSIPHRKSGMVVMALYGLDEFRTFLLRMSILEKLGLDRAQIDAVLDEEEKILDFGFDWMNIILFSAPPAINQKRRRE
jgi:uncharacterized protein